MADAKGSTSTNSDIHTLHKEWDEASCPICMDHPHNSVLLICSSHEKGCRSYICDTSYRHSNCLDRFKKPKVSSGPSVENSDGERRRNSAEDESLEENMNNQEPSGGGELSFLKCPLCRGDVLGWLIVKEARQYLDMKARNCSRESCSYSGNYRELRRHARRDHPTTRPADVDPSRQRAWRRLEHQREYGDILSAIRSAMPGAIVLGDYVLDNSNGVGEEEEGPSSSSSSGGPWWTTFFLFHMISSPLGDERSSGSGSSRGWRTHRRSSVGGPRNLWGENLLGLQDDDDDDITIPRRRRRITRPRPDDEQP